MTARRVLLAWEHGLHHGHMGRLRELATLLRQSGARVLWALPPGAADARKALPQGAEVLPAPVVAGAGVLKGRAPVSFADVLRSFGFESAAALQVAVAQWLRLFDTCRPDVVVLDYAPAAQLAAHVAGLDAVQITNGFDAPPADCPPFGWSVRGPALAQRNGWAVACVDDTVRQVGRALGASQTVSLASMLSHPQTWLDGVPETDPYGPREGLPCVGPLGCAPGATAVPWPDASLAPAGAPRVFAYWRDGTSASALLAALRHLGALALCVWPGAPANVQAQYATGAVRVRAAPIDLTRVLHEADLVVNYGSSTLVCQALLAGTPQWMVPTDVEKWMVARRVARAGAGVMQLPGIAGGAWTAALEAVLANAPVRRQAQALSACYGATWVSGQRQALLQRLMRGSAAADSGIAGLPAPPGTHQPRHDVA